ncbi:MAG: metallophosphoesterase [Clostridia bacterium]|nr:metallophosphoesterase [Clostridia bacterium]
MQKLIDEVKKAKEKINGLRKDDSVVFLSFTDFHSPSAECEQMDKLCSTLKLITDEIPCDMAVNLGDNTGMLGRSQHISNESLKVLLKNMFDRMYDSVNCPMWFVNGNHDAIGTDFFKPCFWNDIVKNKYGNENAVYDDTGSYYYVDVPKAKTRFVVLSVPSESDLDAKNPTPVWAFGEKQIEWMKNVAFNVSGNVIILMHVPFFYRYVGDETAMLEVWNGEKTAMSTISDLSGRIEDIEKAVEIIESFTEKPDANLVACFSGHTHEDLLCNPHEKWVYNDAEYENPLPCKQVVTVGATIPQKYHEEFGISIDVTVWTPSENKLNVIRVGDGEDRKIIDFK